MIKVIKSRGMRWTGHGACMEEKINVCRGNLEKKDYL
jgi:hypothetical protein